MNQIAKQMEKVRYWKYDLWGSKEGPVCRLRDGGTFVQMMDHAKYMQEWFWEVRNKETGAVVVKGVPVDQGMTEE